MGRNYSFEEIGSALDLIDLLDINRISYVNDLLSEEIISSLKQRKRKNDATTESLIKRLKRE